jgi:hypothetical protein
MANTLWNKEDTEYLCSCFNKNNKILYTDLKNEIGDIESDIRNAETHNSNIDKKRVQNAELRSIYQSTIDTNNKKISELETEAAICSFCGAKLEGELLKTHTHNKNFAIDTLNDINSDNSIKILELDSFVYDNVIDFAELNDKLKKL